MDGLVTPVETIDADERLSKALRKLEDHAALIVTKNGRYVGILQPEMLLRFKDNAERIKVGKLVKRGSVVLEDELEAKEVLERFSKSNLKSIVVLDKHQRPIGNIESRKVIQLAGGAFSGRKAEEYLEEVIAIEAETPADKAEELMAKNGASELVVVEKGKIIGMLTARDIAVKIKPYLHKKMRGWDFKRRMDVEKEVVKSILTPEFAIKKVRGDESAMEALKSANFEEAFVFEGMNLRGKLSISKMLEELQPQTPSKIEISGLGTDEELFKDSIFEECSAVLRKFRKGGNVYLRIKSARKGKAKKIYEVHGRLEIDGKRFVCSTPELTNHRENWDLSMAVSEVLGELKKSYLKSKR